MQTADDVPPDDGWLTAREREYAAALRFPKRLQDWRLGRWTAKLAVRRYLGARCADLEIRTAPDGAPEPFLGERPAPISLSISHSRTVALAAVSGPGLALGCDLEYVESRTVEFVIDYFSPEEAALARGADPGRQALLCTLIWSAKESALKSLRDGLRRDTRTVSVTPDTPSLEGHWGRIGVRCADLNRIFQGWWKPAMGFVLTLTADSMPEPPLEISGLTTAHPG